ncbi:MAG: peptide deformylase [Pseudorhodobacter sp.]
MATPALRPIRHWPDPVLSAPCAEIAPGEPGVFLLANDMLRAMYAANGRGLAAPQVGVSKRLFVMDETWKTGTATPRIFINPVVRDPSTDRVTGPEGCLSIPGITVQVSRAAEVTLEWTNLFGTRHSARLAGFAAICAQHEVDHLDGIVTFDRLSPEARAAAERDYADMSPEAGG